MYSKTWNFEYYGLDANGIIDYDQIHRRAEYVKPKLIIAGASSYPRDLEFERFREITDSVGGALLLGDVSHTFGLHLAGEMNNPFPHCDIVTASTSKSMGGPRAGVIYAKKELMSQINNAVFPGILGAPQNNLIGSLATTFKY